MRRTPALTSLQAPLCYSEKATKKKKEKEKETRGGTNSFPRINSHLSFISPFSAPAPPLHLPVVDTGGGFWFLPAVEASR